MKTRLLLAAIGMVVANPALAEFDYTCPFRAGMSVEKCAEIERKREDQWRFDCRNDDDLVACVHERRRWYEFVPSRPATVQDIYDELIRQRRN